MNWAKGKKTYIMAALVFLPALFEFITAGVFTGGSIIAFLQSQQVAILAATLRKGISG